MMIGRDPAQGHWRDILSDAGLEPRFLTGRQTPCPLCGGTDRFRFDDKEGRGTWYCNGQHGAGDGYRMLQLFTGETFKSAVRRLDKLYGNGSAYVPPAKRRSYGSLLNRVWRAGVAEHPELTKYLRSRSLTNVPAMPNCLRYHPACPWAAGEDSGVAPAMIAKIYQGRRPVSIHRTFLTTDVPRRKMVMPHDGERMHGAYIPLLGIPKDGVLGIAEGIETALSASALNGSIPVWSCLSENQLSRFTHYENLEGLYKLIVFGDNDANYVGQAAAYTAATRAARQSKLEVSVAIPPSVGTDWNDVLRGTTQEEP